VAVRLGILGPVRAQASDGSPLPVRGSKQRTALCALIFRRDGPTSVAQLVDDLWEEDDKRPRDPTKTVHTCVSRLRDALPADVVLTTDNGYRLDPDAITVDSDVFCDLLRDGRRASERGDHEHAAVVLARGLDLWRGRPYEELESRTHARPDIDRLLDLKREALTLRIDADLAAGRHRECVAELARCVGSEPLDEPFAMRYMLALYRSGDAVRALEAYDRIMRDKLDALGLPPDPGLIELYEKISRGDPSLLAADASPAATDVGRPAGRRRPFMVPPPEEGLVVRRRLLDDAVALVVAERSTDTTLTAALRGAGGFGKTILAEDVCRDERVRSRFTGGVLWTTLGPRDAGSSLAAKLNVLSHELTGTRSPDRDPESAGRRLGRLLDERGSEPTLVVIDDVWRGEQTWAFRALPAHCVRLLTTRVSVTVGQGSAILVDRMERSEARAMEQLSRVVDGCMNNFRRRPSRQPSSRRRWCRR